MPILRKVNYSNTSLIWTNLFNQNEKMNRKYLVKKFNLSKIKWFIFEYIKRILRYSAPVAWAFYIVRYYFHNTYKWWAVFLLHYPIHFQSYRANLPDPDLMPPISFREFMSWKVYWNEGDNQGQDTSNLSSGSSMIGEVDVFFMLIWATFLHVFGYHFLSFQYSVQYNAVDCIH